MFCVLKKQNKKGYSDRCNYALKINLQCSVQSPIEKVNLRGVRPIVSSLRSLCKMCLLNNANT